MLFDFFPTGGLIHCYFFKHFKCPDQQHLFIPHGGAFVVLLEDAADLTGIVLAFSGVLLG